MQIRRVGRLPTSSSKARTRGVQGAFELSERSAGGRVASGGLTERTEGASVKRIDLVERRNHGTSPW